MHEDFRLEAPIGDDLRIWCGKIDQVLNVCPTQRLTDVYLRALRNHEGTYPMIVSELAQAWKELEAAATVPVRTAEVPADLPESGYRCNVCLDTGFAYSKNRDNQTGVHPCQCNRAARGAWMMRPGWEPVEWQNNKGEWKPVSK